MKPMDPVPYAVPFFMALIVIEMYWARARRPEAYEPRDTLSSLTMGLGSTVAGALTGGAMVTLAFWLYQYRITTLGWAWWTWAACFVIDDFGYYWAHRGGHRIRWMWASHVNHHSSQHYNLSTALRQTWTGVVALNFMFRLPIVLLGFHPLMLFACGGVNLIYQFWIHTEARPPRHQPALPRSQLCRGLHAVGSDVRIVRTRSGRGTDPLWHRQAAGHLQPVVDLVSRMDRDRAGCLGGALGQQVRLCLARAGLEP